MSFTHQEGPSLTVNSTWRGMHFKGSGALMGAGCWIRLSLRFFCSFVMALIANLAEAYFVLLTSIYVPLAVQLLFSQCSVSWSPRPPSFLSKGFLFHRSFFFYQINTSQVRVEQSYSSYTISSFLVALSKSALDRLECFRMLLPDCTQGQTNSLISPSIYVFLFGSLSCSGLHGQTSEADLLYHHFSAHPLGSNILY